jgi:Secretion system C-terminal sorting domain
VRTDINNNTVEFIFQNINLVAATGNPPVGGHGDVLFKIRTKSSLTAGDNVLNKAKIFFDYNAPIVTNDAVTTFAVLNNSVFVSDNSVSVSPNPAISIVNVNANSNVKNIELYDVQGRILETVLNANLIDISNKSNGIYFLKITTDIGSKIEKVVKE